MVAAKIFVALVKAPWNRKAGDDAAEKVLGLVGAQHGYARAIQILFSRLLVEIFQRALPGMPVQDVIVPGRFISREQGRDRMLARLRPHFTEAQSQNELAVAGRDVDFSGQRDVSVFRAVILPFHLEMLRQVLPAVREAGKPDRSFWHGRGTSQCERAGAVVGENHWLSLVIAHPSGIAVSEIRKMRSQQRVEAIVAKIPLERHKANFL